MKRIEFPLLTKDDIEIRIGQMPKDGKEKGTLLLYQDARCGMKYLDQVVGAENWYKRYYECKGQMMCAVGIYIEDRKEWVEKSDTGSTGNFEEEKTLASDSFKRACVCWGLARELYTAPDIWVKIESKYDKFKVVRIEYNAQREISVLEIANKDGVVVYTYGIKGKSVPQEQPRQDQDITREIIRKEDQIFIRNYLMTASDEKVQSFNEWITKNFNVEDYSYLSKDQGSVVVRKLKEKLNG